MNCDANGVPAVTTDLIGMVKVSEGEYRVATAGDTNVVYVVDAGNAVIKGWTTSTTICTRQRRPPATTC